MTIVPQTDALIVIDPQVDFCPGGALAVADGDAILPGINRLAARFHVVAITQDWHPPGHKSFASAHRRELFSQMAMPYGEQTLWPDHCVQGTAGAALHPALAAGALERASLILRKGTNPNVDSYSAFYENDKVTPTGLAGYLRERGVLRIVCVGLAYDFCVAYSALDAVREGFDAVVVRDLTRAIRMPVGDTTTVDLVEAQFAERNVAIVNAADLVLP